MAATTFLETPDATRGTEFWSSTTGTVAYDAVTATKSGIASWKFGDAALDQDNALRANVLVDAGTRISFYLRINNLPGTSGACLRSITSSGSSGFQIGISSTGVLSLFDNDSAAQLGSNGATLSTGVWYRIALSYVLNTSWRVYVDGVLSISASGGGVAGGVSAFFGYMNPAGANKFLNIQHVYIDNLTDLSDPGDIRVTAKRPNANGTTNGFTTQIGAGGSGYGTGHSPQVNERPLSATNGWSMIGAGSAVTEEYNIENISTGDINLTGKNIIDYCGWVYAKALVNETATLIVNGVNSNIALVNANTMFTFFSGTDTYPAGTGADIGIITSTALTTVSLYECGIIVAYIETPYLMAQAAM